jgi:glycosyltransferase involved in cell wall biosynthesis
MKIGIFTESFLPQVNGVVTSICNAANGLSKKHDVEIFTVGKGPARAASCKVHRFSGAKLPTYSDYRFFVPSRDVWGRLSNIRLDIVHVRSSLPFGLIALRFARKRQVPLVGTFDTPLSDYVHYVPLFGKIKITKKLLSNTALKYMIWFYNKCNVVIAPSNVTREWLRKAGCKSEIIVLSNGVDTKRFSRKKRSISLKRKFCPKNEIMLLHVGRMGKEKAVDVLVKAAKTMKQKGMKFVMVMVGKGPALTSLKAMSKQFGIDDCVHFLGFVADKDLPKYYASADVFVTASPVETEGLVMLEAMASGLPVVGANAGAIPDIIRPGNNGFVFKPNDHKDFVRKVSGLVDVKERTRMSKNAIKVSKDFSVEKTVKMLEEIYTNLMASK